MEDIASLFLHVPGLNIDHQKYESILNDKTEKFEKKVQSLIEVWKSISELNFSQFDIKYVIQIIDWAKLHALNIVLTGEWRSTKESFRDSLLECIEKAQSSLASVNDAFSTRCQKLADVVKKPWEDPVLYNLIQERDTEIGPEEIEFFCVETAYLVSVRLKKLCENHCEDLALNLVTNFLKYKKKATIQNLNLNATETQLWFIFDIYIALLYKFQDKAKILEQFRELQIDEGVQLIKRFAKKRVKISKIWRNCHKIAIFGSRYFLSQALMKYNDGIKELLKDLLKTYVTLSNTDTLLQEFVVSVRNLTNLADAEGLCIMCEIIHREAADKLRHFAIEMYIRALTTDMNELERLKHASEEEKMKLTTSRLASTFSSLADLLNDHVKVARECVLTAFSLEPTKERLKRIEELAKRSGFPVLDTGQEWKCKNHPPALPSDDLAWMCHECGEWMCKPELAAPLQMNTPLQEALQESVLGITEALCDDLVVCLSNPRYQILSWLLSWEDLYRLCILYMNDPEKTKNFVTELKFVDVDYSMFDHIKREPVDEYTGIEKGYEQYLDLDFVSDEETSSVSEDSMSHDRYIGLGSDGTGESYLPMSQTKSDPNTLKSLRMFRPNLKRKKDDAELSMKNNKKVSSSSLCHTYGEYASSSALPSESVVSSINPSYNTYLPKVAGVTMSNPNLSLANSGGGNFSAYEHSSKPEHTLTTVNSRIFSSPATKSNSFLASTIFPQPVNSVFNTTNLSNVTSTSYVSNIIKSSLTFGVPKVAAATSTTTSVHTINNLHNHSSNSVKQSGITAFAAPSAVTKKNTSGKQQGTFITPSTVVQKGTKPLHKTQQNPVKVRTHQGSTVKNAATHQVSSSVVNDLDALLREVVKDIDTDSSKTNCTESKNGVAATLPQLGGQVANNHRQPIQVTFQQCRSRSPTLTKLPQGTSSLNGTTDACKTKPRSKNKRSHSGETSYPARKKRQPDEGSRSKSPGKETFKIMDLKIEIPRLNMEEDNKSQVGSSLKIVQPATIPDNTKESSPKQLKELIVPGTAKSPPTQPKLSEERIVLTPEPVTPSKSLERLVPRTKIIFLKTLSNKQQSAVQPPSNTTVPQLSIRQGLLIHHQAKLQSQIEARVVPALQKIFRQESPISPCQREPCSLPQEANPADSQNRSLELAPLRVLAIKNSHPTPLRLDKVIIVPPKKVQEILSQVSFTQTIIKPSNEICLKRKEEVVPSLGVPKLIQEIRFPHPNQTKMSPVCLDSSPSPATMDCDTDKVHDCNKKTDLHSTEPEQDALKKLQKTEQPDRKSSLGGDKRNIHIIQQITDDWEEPEICNVSDSITADDDMASDKILVPRSDIPRVIAIKDYSTTKQTIENVNKTLNCDNESIADLHIDSGPDELTNCDSNEETLADLEEWLEQALKCDTKDVHENGREKVCMESKVDINNVNVTQIENMDVTEQIENMDATYDICSDQINDIVACSNLNDSEVYEDNAINAENETGIDAATDNANDSKITENIQHSFQRQNAITEAVDNNCSKDNAEGEKVAASNIESEKSDGSMLPAASEMIINTLQPVPAETNNNEEFATDCSDKQERQTIQEQVRCFFNNSNHSELMVTNKENDCCQKATDLSNHEDRAYPQNKPILQELNDISDHDDTAHLQNKPALQELMDISDHEDKAHLPNLRPKSARIKNKALLQNMDRVEDKPPVQDKPIVKRKRRARGKSRKKSVAANQFVCKCTQPSNLFRRTTGTRSPKLILKDPSGQLREDLAKIRTQLKEERQKNERIFLSDAVDKENVKRVPSDLELTLEKEVSKTESELRICERLFSGRIDFNFAKVPRQYLKIFGGCGGDCLPPIARSVVPPAAPTSPQVETYSNSRKRKQKKLDQEKEILKSKNKRLTVALKRLPEVIARPNVTVLVSDRFEKRATPLVDCNIHNAVKKKASSKKNIKNKDVVSIKPLCDKNCGVQVHIYEDKFYSMIAKVNRPQGRNKKSIKLSVPGLNDYSEILPRNVNYVVNVVQHSVPRSSSVTNQNAQTSTQVTPHIQRIGQPKLPDRKPANRENPEQSSPSSSIVMTSSSSTSQSSTLVNIFTSPLLGPKSVLSRQTPYVNILSQQIMRPAEPPTTTVIKVEAEDHAEVQATKTVNTNVRILATTTQAGAPTTTTSSAQGGGTILQFICKSSSLPKFQQAFGKTVYQTGSSSEGTSETPPGAPTNENSIQTQTTTVVETKKIATKALPVNVQPITGNVIFRGQVPVGQTVSLIPPGSNTRQLFRITGSTHEQISLVKETVIQNKMSALLAAALQGKPKITEQNGELVEEYSATRITLCRPGTVPPNATRIVKPVQLQIPASVVRAPQPNVSSTTLEQLREFDMVYKQVKERSNNPAQPETSSQNSPESHQQQRISFTYVNQVQKYTQLSPVVVVSNYSPIQQSVSPALSVTSQSGSSPCVTQVSTVAVPKVAVKSSKGKGIKSSVAKTSPTTVSAIPKPQQKPQEDEHTTQRIFDILAEYAEQLRNSPDLNNKPAPRRRSNPPTNPSSNSSSSSSSKKKKKKSSNSTTSNLVETDNEDLTMGSEDSSGGNVVQLSMTDEEQSQSASITPPESNLEPAISNTSTPNRPLIVTDSSNQPRNVIIADSSVGEALKMPNTALLMPGNYIMPVSVVKGGQQITVVSGGSKILTTVPARSGQNMLLFQSFVNQNKKGAISTVKYSTLQPFSGISSQTVSGVSAQSPVVLPSNSVATVALGQPITLKKVDDSDRGSNSELLLTISQPREALKVEKSPGVPQPDSTNLSCEPIEVKVEDQSPSGSPSTEVFNSIQKTSSVATSVIASVIKKEEEAETEICSGDSSAVKVDPSKQGARISSVLVNVSTSNGPMLSHTNPRYRKPADGVESTTVSTKEFSHNAGKAPQPAAKILKNNAVYYAIRTKKAMTKKIDSEMQKQAAMERELRLQKTLSEECEDLGVDEPSTSDLFPEADLLFDSNHSPSYDQSGQKIQGTEAKPKDSMHLFSDDENSGPLRNDLFDYVEYHTSEQGVDQINGNNASNESVSSCDDSTLLSNCGTMSEVTLNSPICSDYSSGTHPVNKYKYKYSNRKKGEKVTKLQPDNWQEITEVTSSEDAMELVKEDDTPIAIQEETVIDETEMETVVVEHPSIAIRCPVHGSIDRACRKLVKKSCSCFNGSRNPNVPNPRKRVSSPKSQGPIANKKLFLNKKR